MFGGIQCKFNWDGNSKICSIQATGQKALTPWLNDQCGQGCRYDDLSYLDLDQVGGLAHTGEGCRFKVMINDLWIIATFVCFIRHQTSRLVSSIAWRMWIFLPLARYDNFSLEDVMHLCPGHKCLHNYI